jgi:hypothetical protein
LRQFPAIQNAQVVGWHFDAFDKFEIGLLGQGEHIFKIAEPKGRIYFL